MKKTVLIILTILILISCKKNGCDDLDCFTPPQEFNFEIVNKDTGENLFTKGIYSMNQITILDFETGNPVEFNFINENNLNIIQLNNIGWKTENLHYLINIGDVIVFSFLIEAERVIENCCSFTKINNLEIKNVDYEIDNINGIYKILVDNSSVVTTKFSYSVYFDALAGNEFIYSLEYNIDSENKVLSEKFTRADKPEFNHLSIFKYNSQGKLIKEIRQGEIYKSIVWDNNVATVYDSENLKKDEFFFDNNRLIEYRLRYQTGTLSIRKFNYNSEDNIISKETESEMFSEYFEYDVTKLNPYHKLLSIGILHPYLELWSNNIFNVQKIYHTAGDDYGGSIRFYNYYYEFDEQERVIKEENDLSAIYIVKFNYE